MFLDLAVYLQKMLCQIDGAFLVYGAGNWHEKVRCKNTMDDMERIMERIKIAYKKFKANVYFDKTQLPLRDRIVKFEEKDIDAKLKALHDALVGSGDWEARNTQRDQSIGLS